MNKLILHLTNVHSYDNYRVYDREIRTVVDAGYDVCYVVPGAKTEKRNGVRFIGVKKYNSEWKRAIFTGWSVFKKALSFPKNSILHFHSPEWLPYGIAAKLMGYTIIYDIHEDVPRQIYTKVWIPKLLKPILAFTISVMETIMFKLADRIVACEPVTYKRFKHQKTILLRNFPLMEEFEELPETERKKNTIIYIGQIFRERGIIEVLKALEKVNQSFDVELILGGKFVPNSLLEECKKLKGWEYVNFRGYMNRSEVIEALSTSCLGVLVLHPIQKYKESYPVKLFEYMAAGLPIIMSDFKHWKESVKPYDVYWTVDPLDISSISKGIETALISEHSIRKGFQGRKAFLENLNWDKEKIKLIEMYKDLGA